MSDNGGPNCVFMFKKRSAKSLRGRRNVSSSDEEKSEKEEPKIVLPTKRKRKLNPNVQTSSKKSIKDSNQISDDSSEENDDESIMVSYKSSRSAMSAGPTDQGATATLQIETENDRDAQAIFEKRLEVNKQLEGHSDDKIYRGINNYAQYIKPKDTAAGNASSGLVRRGPIRAPANLRATVRWDYQPDICKDYKETGFCGFGDSCKFLHDRSDYKHGWQLEQEWTAGEYGKDSDDDKKYEIDSDDDDIPSTCALCKEDLVNPVVTKCKHYFCEKCAIEHSQKSARCHVCNIQTMGTFTNVTSQLAKMKKRKAMKHHCSSSDSD